MASQDKAAKKRKRDKMLIAVYNEGIILREFNDVKVKLINGKVKNKKECCGFCNCERHRGCLSERQMVEHKCNEKKCNHLFIIVDPYKEMNKQKRKEKQKEIRDKEKLLLKLCQDSASNIEGMKVTGISIEVNQKLSVEYVAICSINEKHLIEAIKERMLCYDVRLINKKVDFDRAVEIVYGGEAA